MGRDKLVVVIDYGKILPIVMITLSLVTSIVYFGLEDYRRALYWLCAAGLTAAVTF